MGNIIKACWKSSDRNDHSPEVPVKDISPILEKKQDTTIRAKLVPEIEVESVRSSSSSSFSSTSSTAEDVNERSKVRAGISENVASDISDEEQSDNGEANKESSSVLVENDQCSPDFDESSDKDNEVVNEPVTQIEVLNNDAIDDSNCDEVAVEES